MYNWEKTLRDDRYGLEKQNPSFSSTLLDKIYRSIDDGDTRETMANKQSRAVEDEEMLSLRQACLLEKWMEKKVKEKVSVVDTKSKLDHDYDHDALFFSSGSNSSESSSGGLSSSDTESIYGAKPSNYSCFARPKPIRTRSEKTERTGRALFYEQRELHLFDDYHFSSDSNQHTQKLDVDGFIKSKSRALKIYRNLKNLKQPISPGGRLAGFLNSIFTAGNGKNPKNPSSTGGQRVSKSAQHSTCSSASSFSRSCLSKNSPASREKLRNGVKRSVRFCPVASLYEEESTLISVSVPTAWKIGKSPPAKNDATELNKLQEKEKSRRVEEAARDFLKKYHQKQSNANYDDYCESEQEDDEEDDAASCSSSDLFELDHLAVMGRDRYREELPVYETTRVDKNRAIANKLMM